MLLYANDVVFLADNKTVLQLRINRLSLYCKKWNLIVNLDKSKILIFNKHGRTSREEKWHYNGIEIVKEYKYLGIILTSNLSWRTYFEEKLRVLKYVVMSNWNRMFRNKSIKLSIKHQFFKTCCQSIVCYGAQIWGSEKINDVED